MFRVAGHSAGHRSQVARRHFYIFIVFALIGPLLSAKQAASTTGEPAELSSFSKQTVFFRIHDSTKFRLF